MPQWQRNLYVLFVAELVSVMGFTVIYPFLSLYVDRLGAGFGNTEFWAGLVFSAHALTAAITSPIWGSVSDRFGRKMMVQRAMFGSTVVVILMGFVRSAEQLVLLQALLGTLSGTVPAANALVAATTPRQRTGYAMGLMQMGIWTGASIGPIVGGVVADTLGFHSAFFLTAACLFLAGIGVTIFVHEEFVPNGEAGLDGRGMLRGWLDVLRTPDMPRIYSMRILVRIGQTMLMPFLPLFVVTLLASQDRVSSVTGLAMGAASATSALTSVYLGRLGDRIGHRRLLIVSALGVALGYAPMTLVTQGWQLVVLYAIMGVGLGGVAPAMAALMTHAAPEGRMGAVYGLDNSLTSGGRVFAPLLCAMVISLSGLRSMFVLEAGIFGLLALIALSGRTINPLQPEEYTPQAGGRVRV
jgi:DHA1 family multidrug resistance protein-like MFS transporter